MRIVGPDDETLHRIRARLAELSITFRQEGRTDQPVADAEGRIAFGAEFTIDHIIQRGVAKIAFNYLAYVHGPDFALRSDFDAIRRFIRFNEKLSWQLSGPTGEPILLGDTRDLRQTNGHLIVIQWDKARVGIVSQISLFNEITHRVRLCARFSDLWFPLPSGHVFDIETRTIAPLGHTNGC